MSGEISWLQLHFQLPANWVDAAADALNALGAQAVTMQDPADDPIYEPDPNATPLWADTRVSALFASDADIHAIKQRLNTLFQHEFAYKEETLLDQDWVRITQAQFNATCFGGRIWICPSWETPPQADAVNIFLDPGVAFGTGSHATTAMCLEWLAQHAHLKGKVCVDYGCGSGILALAAAKLGATKIWAVDHEPQALQATRDNAERNGVAACIETCLPQDFPAVQADVVLANILAQPLCDLATFLTRLLPPGGWIALSGILREQESMVRHCYAPYVQLEPPHFKDDWVALVGRRLG
jgi:ribosomal protein L11 methyltransferase